METSNSLSSSSPPHRQSYSSSTPTTSSKTPSPDTVGSSNLPKPPHGSPSSGFGPPKPPSPVPHRPGFMRRAFPLFFGAAMGYVGYRISTDKGKTKTSQFAFQVCTLLLCLPQ